MYYSNIVCDDIYVDNLSDNDVLFRLKNNYDIILLKYYVTFGSIHPKYPLNRKKKINLFDKSKQLTNDQELTSVDPGRTF